MAGAACGGSDKMWLAEKGGQELLKSPNSTFADSNQFHISVKTIRVLVNPSTTHFTPEARGIVSMGDCVYIRQLYMNTCCPHSTIDNP